MWMEIEKPTAAGEVSDAQQTVEQLAEAQLAAEASSRQPRSKTILHFAIVGAGAAVIWLVTWLAFAKTIGLGTVTLSLIVPSACVILFNLIIVRQEQKWIWPVRKMNILLPQIRAGERTIDSLNEVEGGL